ncbi:MAG: tRNA (guanosine(37)-N1)-methyltransferase TrmD [Candidatus Puniceispirillaceae bacterium]
MQPDSGDKKEQTPQRFEASILTLFPEMFPASLGHSLAGRAQTSGIWSLDVRQIRDYATDKHRTVDDAPLGGGHGLVMKPDVVSAALDDVANKPGPRLYMSPRGRPLCQSYARELSQEDGVVIVCGRYEGLDQRVITHHKLTEVSVGDYILSGGELAAQILLDSVIRLLPGVMGKEIGHLQESFETGLLEHDHYTQPRVWNKMAAPDILASGHHQKIAAWREEQAKKLTKERRPDLWKRFLAKNVENSGESS